MSKIGLALSGGGFRATLFHLGLIRFLRDAGHLPQVTHITSVSGGSIMAAHLVLNWKRYTESESGFEEAAAELLSFLQLDIRNRILRRFPLTMPVAWARRLVGRSCRELTRAGLLERHYRKYLYGDVSLFELPKSPQLHLLTTNLSEGCLCSFHRDGLLIARPQELEGVRFDEIHTGLATVSMAVAASSAFPGFFPPLELSGADVGATGGDFVKQAYTDGGVYDNLGVRMFRFLERQIDFDCVIVSDVGRQIKVVKAGGGLIRSALRSSDILMNRVWQLENEAFKSSSEFVLARVTDVIEHEEDPSAPHPEIQRHLAGIRTDLDRFSSLEISSLVRHGYCVARKVCRERPDIFGSDLPGGKPWDPQAAARNIAPSNTHAASRHEQSAVTADARALQASSARRFWGSLFDRRDWVSFVYVPIIVPLLLFLPYVSLQYYKRMVRLNHLTLSYAQGSPDLAQLDRMLDREPMKPWKGVPVEETGLAVAPDFSGFKVLSDSRITDLRAWNPNPADKDKADSRVYIYRRLSVVRTPEQKGPALFSVRLILTGAEGEVRFPTQALPARVTKTAPSGETRYHWDAVFDFTKAPVGVPMDLLMEVQAPGVFLRGNESSTGMGFAIEYETAEMAQWVLMPASREYRNFRYIRFMKGQPGTAEEKRFVSQYLAKDHGMLGFKLLSLDPGYEHEITWDYN